MKTGQELKEENIKKIIDNHLVARVVADNGVYKENYNVATVNLIHFIGKYFTLKKEGMEAIIEINKRYGK